MILMLSAYTLQRLERPPPEVSGVVEKKRLQGGVEECHHQVAEILHIRRRYLHPL